jgi:hypothetical protein
MRPEPRHLWTFCLALAAMLPIVSAPPVAAYDPTAALRNLYGAPYVAVTIYSVKPGDSTAFLDAMVKAGPYDRFLAGMANDRILEALPGQNIGPVLFFCVSRYYDRRTAEFVETRRDGAIGQFLSAPPVRLNAKLIEHLLADWGWERGTGHSIVQAKAFERDEIFERHISSLSFFKAGYVGQIGFLEFFPAGTSLDTIRARVSARRGLSGASIFMTDNAAQHVVYSEFFSAPPSVGTEAVVISGGGVVGGAQAGTVVQNYVPR